jgi:hypothetical protein
MAALVRYVCDLEHSSVPHDSPEAPSLTVYEGEWAYCPTGGTDEHHWRTIDPALPIEKMDVTPHGRFVLL